jgi:hypothetical protein
MISLVPLSNFLLHHSSHRFLVSSRTNSQPLLLVSPSMTTEHNNQDPLSTMATMSASQEKVLDSNLTSYSPSLITNDGPPSAPEQLPTAETPDESQALADFNPGWRFYMVFITLAAVTLAAALDATSLSVALPTIAQELNGTAIEAFWAGTSFLLTSTVFQPTFASMSNIFGRKPVRTLNSHF